MYVCAASITIIIFPISRRLVHAFTCAGMLPQQYIKLSKFAEIGVNGKWDIDKGNGTFDGTCT